MFFRRRRRPRLRLWFTLFAGLAVLALASTATAERTHHRCGGKTATIVGTNEADIVIGTPGDDVIVALAGNDRIGIRPSHLPLPA